MLHRIRDKKSKERGLRDTRYQGSSLNKTYSAPEIEARVLATFQHQSRLAGSVSVLEQKDSHIQVCLVDVEDGTGWDLGYRVAQWSKALYLSARGIPTVPGSNPGCITFGCDWESHRAAHIWPSAVRVWPV